LGPFEVLLASCDGMLNGVVYPPACQSARNPTKHAPMKSGDYLVGCFRSGQKFGLGVADPEQAAAARF
jgi:hypothetical protein